MGEKKKKEKKEEKAEEAPAAPAAPKKKVNVMAMFNQQQIQEFKEAHGMMDVDRDGVISEEDLAGIYGQVGREPDAKQLKAMIKECDGQLNFTGLLGLFGENMSGTDPENKLRDAFKMFDEKDEGFIPEDYMKELLMTVGDLYTKDEIKQVWKEAPISSGKLDYMAFVTLIKRGKEEEA
jgi:Ca2+-binding EF-hand superfamily protein